MMIPKIIYLHGFASSPNSIRARFFRDSLSHWDMPLGVPDLNVPDFYNLTLSAMIERVDQEVREEPNRSIYLIGSSMGALVALHFVDKYRATASRVKKLLFLAPAFSFIENRYRELGTEGMTKWEQTGKCKFHHYGYGKELDVSFALINDLRQYDSYSVQIDIPIFIVHGRQDKQVDPKQSIKFSESLTNLHLKLVDSDHQLTNQASTIWEIVVRFFDLCSVYPRKTPITINSYDLANSADILQFQPHQNDFLDILDSAYGTKFFGREGHLLRIYSEKHIVLLAFEERVDTPYLVACSYIRPDGKRSATAVRPTYQGRGIARQLICFSKTVFQQQFVEITISNLIMQHLLVSCGFTYVSSEQILKRHLGKDADLLRSIRYEGNKLVYIRQSNIRPDIEREFVMFEYQNY